MALFQIRKGSTANKGTLAAGELYDNTELQTLQLGIDGTIEVTMMTSASIVNAISASLEASILALSASVSNSISASTANLSFNSASLEQSIIDLSSSVYTTDSTQTNNITNASASAFRTFQSASSYSASIYTRDAGQDTLITQASASAWGAYTSASSYSASFYTTLNNTTTNVATISASAWGAFQSASSYSASNATWDNSQDSRLAALETYSASVKNAIELTGSAVTIQGDLFVRGTTTTINSTIVNLSASFIEVDAGGAVNGGMYVIDRVGGGGGLTGSLVWDVNTNIWKGGEKGSELEFAHSIDISNLSASIHQTDLTQSISHSVVSASAWGAYTSASSYSSSFYTTTNNLSSSIYETDATQSNNIATISASAWGAFQSASSYSASLENSIINVSQSISTSLSVVSASLNTFSASYKTDSSSFDTRISASIYTINGLILGAGAQVGANNIFTGQNTFAQYITGSISGAVDGIDVRELSASLNTRVIAATNEQYLSGFATTGSNTFNGSQNIIGDITASGNLYVSGTIYTYELHTIIESSSVFYSSGSTNIGDNQNDVLTITGSLNQTGSTLFSELTGSLSAFSASLNTRIGNTNVESLSASIYQTDITQSNNIATISASAWGAFQSASSYSASIYTRDAEQDTNITQISSSAFGAFQSASSYSASIYTRDAGQDTLITEASASAWGAFQSASSYSASIYTTNLNLSSSIQNLSGSLNSISGALQTSINNTSSSLYSLSGSVYSLSGSVTSISGALQNSITNLSSSIATTDATQTANITTAQNSANGAFASASAYSASAFTTYAKLNAANSFTGVQTIDGNTIITGSLLVTGDVTAYASSDERLKDNIQLISNPIEKVQQLRGVEFDWNDRVQINAGEHSYGVIAQDVLKVMPELVKQRYDGYYGVEYDKMVALLIEVVKDQEKRIKELENKLSS